MLFDRLNQVMDRIDALDPKKEAPVLLRELKNVSPGYWKNIRDGMKKKGSDDKLINNVEMTIARGVLAKIKEMPRDIKELVRLVKAPETHAAYRCALVGILALIVKKKDLIPDDAPGGYGFVDDLILLHAAIVLYLNALPTGVKNIEEENKILEFLMIAVPERDHAKIQTAVSAMAYACQLLSSMPQGLLDNITQQVIQNPDVAELTPPPPGPPPNDATLPSTKSVYDWGGGITAVEDGNVHVTFHDGGFASLTSSGELVVQAT